jgi:hypothetical protein
VSRNFETRLLADDAPTAEERKRRNHPVFDVPRTVVRTYRDLCVHRGSGATLADLHAEGFNRFTSGARRDALDVLMKLGHVEAFRAMRTFPATTVQRGITRTVTVYRLTAAGLVQAEAGMSAEDRAHVEARRARLAELGR